MSPMTRSSAAELDRIFAFCFHVLDKRGLAALVFFHCTRGCFSFGQLWLEPASGIGRAAGK
jgi:hypothetical protein